MKSSNGRVQVPDVRNMNSHGFISIVSKLRTPWSPSSTYCLLIHLRDISCPWNLFICLDLPNSSTFGTFFTSTIFHHSFFSRQATVRRPCGSTSRARAKASEVARSEFAAEMAKMMLLGFSTYFFTKSLSVCRFSVKAVVKEGCKHGDNMSTKKRTCCIPVEIEEGRQ